MSDKPIAVDARVMVTGGKYSGMMGVVIALHEDGDHAHVESHTALGSADRVGGPFTRLVELSHVVERKPGEVHVREWVKRGAMQVRCDCLEEDDPAHPYNQIIAQGEVPETFGVFISTSDNSHMLRKIHELEAKIEELESKGV